MKFKLPVLVLAIAVLAGGGEFRTRLDKSENVTLLVPRPAEVALQAKSFDIQYVAGQSGFKRQVELAQLIQQALSRQFEFSNSKPDVVLQFTVIAYEPVMIGKQTQTEMRSINVGSAQKPQFEERSVPVVYQLVHGSLTAGVTTVDNSGHIADTFEPTVQIARRKELLVNGQAPTEEPKSWSDAFKIHSQPKSGQPVVETAESLETDMLQEIAIKVQRRYTSATDQVEIALAVDSPLRLGDKLAESGQWKEALDSWSSAAMKHNPSDRLYNLAVAKEALAYVAFAHDNDLDALLPKFKEAMDLYTQALHGDPGEKYMRQAVDRLHLARSDIETARRIKVEQDAATEQAVAAAGNAVQQRKLQEAALNDHSPDTPDQASFRQDVRVQLAEIKGEVPAAKRDQLIAFGERLQLSHLQSYRVVAQEIQRKKNIGQALQDYEDVFKPLVADGNITPSERSQLRNLAKREALDASDVKSIESKYHFTEISASRSPVRQNKSALTAEGAH